MHRQGVHVGAQADAAPALAEGGDDAGLRQALHLLEAQRPQAFGHEGGGARLLEAQLGVGMQIAAQGRERVEVGAGVRAGAAWVRHAAMLARVERVEKEGAVEPHAFWQRIEPAEAAAPPPWRERFPARLPDGRVLTLPIRALGDGERGIASLILNQARFAVEAALADA